MEFELEPDSVYPSRSRSRSRSRWNLVDSAALLTCVSVRLSCLESWVRLLTLRYLFFSNSDSSDLICEAVKAVLGRFFRSSCEQLSSVIWENALLKHGLSLSWQPSLVNFGSDFCFKRGCCFSWFVRCLFNPRTAGGLSHLRTAGGGGRMTGPPKNSKTKKDSDKP